jgi:hypothetical protein
MKQYGMSLKTGKDLIMLTRQDNLELAIEYFSKLKQLPLKKFNEIFVVIEIKNETK